MFNVFNSAREDADNKLIIRCCELIDKRGTIKLMVVRISVQEMWRTDG